MAHKITESAIETFAIELLEKHGYQYIYGPDSAPDSETPERTSFEDVILAERLKIAVARINPTVPTDARDEAVKQIMRLNSPELIANNEAFHRLLTEGIKVTYQKDGQSRGDLVWLIDFNDPENNDFIVLNQYTVVNTSPAGDRGANKRPDMILFVNGLPLVVIELKNPADENAHRAGDEHQPHRAEQTDAKDGRQARRENQQAESEEHGDLHKPGQPIVKAHQAALVDKVTIAQHQPGQIDRQETIAI